MPKKVLVCDDELHILESVSYVIRGEGYTVFTAEDGDTALQLARQELPDLVVLDIMMPRKDGMQGKDGFEVCRELKSDPKLHGVYVILLTAMGQERDMEEGQRSGADEYMTKPYAPRALARRLHELLDTHL